MDAGISRIAALVGVIRIRVLTPYPFDDPMDGARLQKDRVVDQHDLGAVLLEQPDLVLADRIAQVEFRAITPRRGDSGEADAGIAAGQVDDQLPRLEQTPFLGVADDAPGCAVLDAAGRVQILDLREQLRLEVLPVCEALKRQQGRVADERSEVVDSHGVSP